jgi:hypothetical protein
MKQKQAVRKIESSPIREEGGKWVVYFAENGECIGMVHVFDGYTKSGWDDEANVTDDVRFRCEDHAVELYKAMMLERIREVLLDGMSRGSCLGIIPIETKEELSEKVTAIEKRSRDERDNRGPNSMTKHDEYGATDNQDGDATGGDQCK